MEERRAHEPNGRRPTAPSRSRRGSGPIRGPLVGDGPAGARTLTDLDVLAFRFPSAEDAYGATLDPALGADAARHDMIIGEVKEGRARLNASALDHRVIEGALVRFGCCTAAAAPGHVRELIGRGSTQLRSGHMLRLVVFGAARGAEEGPAHVVGLGHVVRFLRGHLRKHWASLRHVDSKDPAFGFLITLEKGAAGRSRTFPPSIKMKTA